MNKRNILIIILVVLMASGYGLNNRKDDSDLTVHEVQDDFKIDVTTSDILDDLVFIDDVFINVINTKQLGLDNDYVWSSNNPGVINTNGKVLNDGSVTLKASKGNVSKSFEITVKDKKVSQITQNDLEFNYHFLSLNSNKVGSKFTPKYIVIHNTANSAPSINEVKYLHNNTSSTSYHFAVDDENIYQAIPTNYNAWHAGNRNINTTSIGIELAKSTISDVKVKDRVIENGARLTAMLLKEYNLGIESVITHKDASGKHCPHDLLDRYGWDYFISKVKENL